MQSLRAPKFLLILVILALSLSTPIGPALASDNRTVLSQTASASLPSGVQRVTSVEGITEYRLDNGLRVLLFPDPSKQTITVNVTYLVGSRHENYGETGMAHLLEHLMFKGSPEHKNIPQELTEHGARSNGNTKWDRTIYYETLPATDAGLDWAISLESDRMVNSFIARKDLDSEMTVVRNEYESGENSPFGVALKRLMAAAYNWHNYGKTPIGARSDIENVPIDRLQAFYHKYYQPDNAVLLVAGKLDPSKTLGLIASKFGKIPRPARSIEPIYTIEPTQDGERTAVVRRVGDTQVALVGYHIPSGSHPDSAAIDILTQIFSDEPSGRLYKSLVEAKKAAAIQGVDLQLHDPGMLIFFAMVRKEDSLESARDAMAKTVEEFTKQPPAPEEVDRARTSLLKNIDTVINSSDDFGIELSDWIALGDWRMFFLHRDELKKVAPADVQRVAAAYLKPSNRTVALFIPTDKPDRAEIPASVDVEARLKDYKGAATVAEGEAFDPSVANIASRISEADLPSGLKVTMLPKKTRGNTVNVSLTLRFGDEKSLMNRDTAAEFAGQMLMRGTAKHTRQQIQDEFDKLKAHVNVTGGATSAGGTIETIRDNLPAVLALVAEILKEPSFPDSEFDLVKQETLAALESRRREPQAVAITAFQRHFNLYPKGDPRYVATIDDHIEEIKAAKLADASRFYGDFYGASSGEVAIVGDFDAKAVSTALGSLFGSWKSPHPYARLAGVYKDIPAGSESFETPDKANAFFVAGLLLNLRDDDPDYPGLVLGNYILGGGFLNSRLATRIRQKEGLSYTVASQLDASAVDKFGHFTAFAIYAPQNVSKLEAAFKEEINRALKDGFTAEELAAAKSGLLQSRQVSRAQDPSLAAKLSSYRSIGRSIQWDADFESKIAALTPDQISAALRRFIDLSRMTIVKAGDFAKAAAK
jgi:zinc protease